MKEILVWNGRMELVRSVAVARPMVTRVTGPPPALTDEQVAASIVGEVKPRLEPDRAASPSSTASTMPP